MKSTVILFLAFIFSGCSVEQVKFNDEVNCSPRAMDHLKGPKEKSKLPVVSDAEAIKIGENLKQSFIVLKDRAKSCYDASPDRNTDKHVCAVFSTNEKGTLSFIDIVDYAHPISSELHKCLSDLISNSDYSYARSITVTQPLHFYSRR